VIRSVPSASEPDSMQTKPIQKDCGELVGKGEIKKALRTARIDVR